MEQPTIHATAIRLAGKGIVIRGPSGSGKSRLALALLTDADCWPTRHAERADPRAVAGDDATALISDDRLIVKRDNDRLLAGPPTALAGLIEVRGMGLLSMPWCEGARLDLVIDLKPLAKCDRLPTPQETRIDGVRLPAVGIPTGDLAHQKLMTGVALRLIGRRHAARIRT